MIALTSPNVGERVDEKRPVKKDDGADHEAPNDAGPPCDGEAYGGVANEWNPLMVIEETELRKAAEVLHVRQVA